MFLYTHVSTSEWQAWGRDYINSLNLHISNMYLSMNVINMLEEVVWADKTSNSTMCMDAVVQIHKNGKEKKMK